MASEVSLTTTSAGSTDRAVKPILEIRNVSKTFPGVRALKNVSFDLLPGEVHALVGENGAGKSTLIKIISGDQPPDAGGEIVYKGKAVRLTSPRAALALGVSTVYQEFNFCPDLNVLENLYIGRSLPTNALGLVDWTAARKRARDVLASLDVKIDLSVLMRDLSPTLRKITEIARALMYEAEVVIFDEPTAALPEHETENLFRVIRRLKEMKVGVIYISHRLKEIFELADRVTVFRDGEKIGTHEVKAIDTQTLISMMVGRPLSNMYVKKSAVMDQVALRVEKLSVSGIFKDVSFELHRGEILGFGGLVGSGRSELAETIAGVFQASGGRIWVGDQPVRIRSVQDAIRHGIALVPEERQSQGLVLGMQIADNMTLPSLPRFSDGPILVRKKQNAATKEFVESLRVVCASLLQPARRLSGGNQQKVVLGKWLMTRPQVLILDEPTRGIDVGAKAEIYALMSDMAAKGLGIIMISSELPELLAMSDRILVLHKGTLTGEFLQSEATQEKIMYAATNSALDGSPNGGVSHD